MCGVVAVVAPRLSPGELRRLVADLTTSLAHRGPDHSAHTVRGPVALGHTRLRVVDARPEADQPMSFEDMHLVFSGAISNFRQLRRELMAEHGVVFRTTSDTEVLLHTLRIFDDRALERLKGMFAFVLHDARRGRVLAARDRCGIKPLVWARRADGAVVMASEAQAIIRAAGVDRSVDRIALQQMLRFNHPLGDRTFFESVRSLEPGAAMSLDIESPEPRPRRWWSLRLSPAQDDLDSAAERLDSSFRASIRGAVDVDVPYGCYLSGGVDSSGIVAELVKERHSPRLYSLVLPSVRYSEEKHIDRFTELLHVRTEKVAIEGLSLRDYVEYATRAEMPQWWTSDLALAELARRARRDGTAVVLTGEGPDELFAGYEIYRVARLRGLLTRAGALVGASAAALPVVKRFVPWLDVDMSVASAYLASHSPRRSPEILDHFGFHPENLALWEVLEARSPLAPPLIAGADRYRESERAYFRDQLAPSSEGLSTIERNLHFEITERLPRWILHMGDRMSSTHGVELRFPYLDDDFVAASLRIPMRLRATLFEDKRVLRRMHGRRLPPAIAKRRKQPLYTPTAEWLGPVLSDPGLSRYWSRDAFDRAGLLDFAVCDVARARLARGVKTDALTGMADEWLFSFALTTSILAVDLCGA
jgi:asparagine synthase (glutamine-hydrolysing)